MAQIAYNGLLIGSVRSNYKFTTPLPVGKTYKLIFCPDKNVKGTPYYFEPFTIPLDEIRNAPNIKEIIEKRLKEKGL